MGSERDLPMEKVIKSDQVIRHRSSKLLTSASLMIYEKLMSEDSFFKYSYLNYSFD